MLIKGGGTVSIDSQVIFRGRSSYCTAQLEIYGVMTLDALVTERGRDTWSSDLGSVFHLDHLTVGGTFKAGLLSIANGLRVFTVSSSGVVTVQTTGEYKIEQTNIAGHVTTYTPMKFDFPLIGTSLMVSSGGVFDIDFEGPRGSAGEGAVNSTILVDVIVIHGMWQAGSLWVICQDFTVAGGGIVMVTGGGHFGDEGPGEYCIANFIYFFANLKFFFFFFFAN